MRKFQKKQAMDFLEVLSQAHNEIEQAIRRQDTEAAAGLLADCQEGAISLGNLIEQTEGEDSSVIKIIEEYCELIYQIHENLSQGHPSREQSSLELPSQGQPGQPGQPSLDPPSLAQSSQEHTPKDQAVNTAKAGQLLRQAFYKIRNSLSHIPERTEVVFLPYKASMWDSLESAWKEADANPDCDAYVIPIPYYDKNPDGSFREMHYEGAQYPPYVPITSYNDYDFSKRLPDKIFIHNPYDEYNYVTSVLPFFYSENLKKYTDELIYIPYFVLDESIPDDPAVWEAMEKFCVLPGVFYADKVIVQSENMRQLYINVLLNSLENTPEQRRYWESKILGLGSPKIDKVLHVTAEDVAIPDQWMHLILKPSGERKKVILYNVSVTSLLQHDTMMLDKIKHVFQTFRENQDHVVLLWRPHPLLKATINSMRPELLTPYQTLIDQYCREGWGIYDDTPDLNRAIALSDGYYGDPSSLVQLCKTANIPVMIQNIDLI